MDHSVSGYLLSRKPSSESFEVWSLFTREQGLLHFLHRLPSTEKRHKRGNADLWDRLDLEWQRPSKNGEHAPRFVKDFRIQAHHEALGKDWLKLERASRLAHLLERNLADSEARMDLFKLVENVMQAWASPAPADAVLLKFLLRWIHLEGYGHPEQWPGATPESRDIWCQLARNPVSHFIGKEVHWKYALSELETFLRTETAFSLP